MKTIAQRIAVFSAFVSLRIFFLDRVFIFASIITKHPFDPTLNGYTYHHEQLE